MSAERMGEYEVFALLRTCLMNGLSEFGISTGVDVRRFAQANFNHGDKLVLLNLVKTARVGWQARSYGMAEFDKVDKFARKDSWIEEQTYQVSCIKKMLKTDDETTLTAEDMSTSLITWLNGRGLDWLREHELSCYPIDPNSIIVYNDDSDLYQRRPVFSVTVIVNKSFKVAHPDVEVVGVETMPV